MDINKIKQNYYFAVDLIEETIKKEIDEFGDDGLELNYRPKEVGYSVIAEIEPNNFKIVRKVRVYRDNLQIMFEDGTEWKEITGMIDWVFFLEEVIEAIDAEYNR